MDNLKAVPWLVELESFYCIICYFCVNMFNAFFAHRSLRACTCTYAILLNVSNDLFSVLASTIVCLAFCVLSAFKVISGRVPTRDSAHSWRLYSAAPLGNQAFNTLTWYCTQSHCHDTDPCPILIMSNTLVGSDKYQFYKSLV